MRTALALMVGFALGSGVAVLTATAFGIQCSGTSACNGGPGDDYMEGDATNNLMYGNGGNDGVHGKGGTDQLFGGTGAENIDGER